LKREQAMLAVADSRSPGEGYSRFEFTLQPSAACQSGDDDEDGNQLQQLVLNLFTTKLDDPGIKRPIIFSGGGSSSFSTKTSVNINYTLVIDYTLQLSTHPKGICEFSCIFGRCGRWLFSPTNIDTTTPHFQHIAISRYTTLTFHKSI
jgi:hypothetical protein